ncbi:MAG: NYN domain-containing protein [Selenomonadaceae bacterium]
MTDRVKKDTVVAILYDIENAPFEMLDYVLGKARKYLPGKIVAASDWKKRPSQKRWNRLMHRDGVTFLQIDRKVNGKNSLDYALFDAAVMFKNEGVKKFFIITTDSDFAKISDAIKADDNRVNVVGVGTKQASQKLRNACNEFLVYPPNDVVPEPPKKKTDCWIKAEVSVKAVPKKIVKKIIEEIPSENSAETILGNLQIKVPITLHRQLCERAKAENVEIDQLVIYLLTSGLIH